MSKKYFIILAFCSFLNIVNFSVALGAGEGEQELAVMRGLISNENADATERTQLARWMLRRNLALGEQGLVAAQGLLGNEHVDATQKTLLARWMLKKNLALG